MRRIRTTLAALVLTGAVLFTTAVPAQAASQQLRGVYYDQSFCNWYGGYGVQNGMWSWYRCEFVSNGSPYPPNGYWFLWA